MKPALYAKAITAAVGAGFTAAIAYYPHATWMLIVVAVVTPWAVYSTPNSGGDQSK